MTVGYSDDDLNNIYDKTNGYCAYCGKKLAFCNYGQKGSHGAWEVDHSNPRSRGGTDYLRNLVPACIDCNREKGTSTGKSYRASWERSEQSDEADLGRFILSTIVAIGTACVLATLLSKQGERDPYRLQQ